nr:TetR/AcrR family transcriptional regulator [Deltaproteobacteria bacterium]
MERESEERTGVSRKEAILMAATELFAQRGYGATPTSDIAQAAGVAEGTLFHHFKTKEGILAYIVKDMLDDYVQGIEMQAEKASNGLEAIKGVICFHFRFINERSGEVMVMLRDFPFHLMEEDTPFREIVSSRFFHLVNLFKGLIETGQKDGSIRRISAEKTAFILIGMLNGLGRQTLMCPLKIPDIYQEVLDFCYNSLAKRG